MLKSWIVILLLLLATNVAIAQLDSLYSKGISLQTKLIGSITKHYENLSKRIDKQTAGYIKKLEKKELQLKKELAKKDSLKAEQVFGNVQDKYKKLQQQLQNKTGKLQGLNSYIPGLDSINTASKCLSQLKSINPTQLTQLKELSNTTNNLQQQLQSATNIQQILKDRKQQLEQALSQNNITKQLQSFNKQAYYYQQQITEYKNLLNDESKLEQKALGLVRELPAFKDFMSKNSQLAQLFRLPGNYGTPQALAGLQTRASIDQLIQQRLGTGLGSNTGNNPTSNSSIGNGAGSNFLQQQLQQAQGQLSQLKDKVNQLGGNTNQDIQMPQGFKPNTQKTKSFLQRIEYGINIQSQKLNSLLPTTSDIAGTIGYKLNDKSIIGIGASYKLGWGSGLNNIKLTNEGIGLRSYIDIKLKGSIWITGGYEQNYLQGFDKFPQLNDYSKWQQSGLIGLSKKYSIGKKKGNLQLLYDMLSKQHTPQTQPLLFRVGYIF
ncbi:MAG: hypothetical protein JST29_01480 [Bacteroidetes bacterium]|nr:hypothetical protein [Bacteroidota bacterium]